MAQRRVKKHPDPNQDLLEVVEQITEMFHPWRDAAALIIVNEPDIFKERLIGM